jgi:hypothetical protein
LPTDCLRPAWHGPVRPPPAQSPAAVGVLCRGPGRGPGRGRRRTGRAAGRDRRRPNRDLLRRDQTGTRQRPHPVAHHRQVRGHRRLPDRDARKGRRGTRGPDRPAVGLRGLSRDGGAQPRRRPAVSSLVGEARSRRRQPGSRPAVHAGAAGGRCPPRPAADPGANPGHASTGLPVHPCRAWPLPRRAHPQGELGRASRGRPDPHLGNSGARPGPYRGLPDRRPPDRGADADPGHGAVHRHRRLHRAGQPAGGPALARTAQRARRGGPAAGRGVRRPAGQDHRRRHAGDLRRPRPGDPLRGRAQRRAGWHRRPAPGGAAHRRG